MVTRSRYLHQRKHPHSAPRGCTEVASYPEWL